MTDPADIIAAAIQQPPEWPGTAKRPGVDGTALWWAHLATMSNPGGPALARHIAGAALETLSQAGWVIIPSGDMLPSAEQIRRWLLAHGWFPGADAGTAGTLWTPPGNGVPVGVPYDSDDPGLLSACIRRVADRLGRADDRITREMLLCDDT